MILEWDFLQTATDAVNAEAFALIGRRDTCVLSAHALDAVLRYCRLRSYVLRVETLVIHDASDEGAMLGLDPDEENPVPPGVWSGHLAVAVERDWLCDPSVDQAQRPEWGGDRLRPLVLRLPRSFWANDRRGLCSDVGPFTVHCRPHLTPQSGFEHLITPNWQPVAYRALERMRAARTGVPTSLTRSSQSQSRGLAGPARGQRRALDLDLEPM